MSISVINLILTSDILINVQLCILMIFFKTKTAHFNTVRIITSVDAVVLKRLLGVGASSTTSSTGAGS